MGNSTLIGCPAPTPDKSQNTDSSMMSACSACVAAASESIPGHSISYDSPRNQLMPIFTAENTPETQYVSGVPYVAGTPQERAAEKKMLTRKSPEQDTPDLPVFDAREIPDAIITVQLQKTVDTQRLMIRTVPCQGSHCIVWIYPGGLLDNWNRANPGKAVQVSDHIVEVNGVQQDESIIKEAWLSEAILCLKFVAAEVIAFTINKEANQMLGIKTRASAKVHQITSITAGGVVDLLEKGTSRDIKRNQGKTITINTKPKIGDYIVEVNGLRGDADFLRQEWICNTRADIVVISPRLRAPANEEQSQYSGNANQAEEQDG